MPLYNEENSIRKTVDEWLAELKTHSDIEFDLLLIDDGSKDTSLTIIRELADSNPHIIVKSGPNQGHGKSCMDGYAFAFEKGYDLVLQLDSDGQCDPLYFPRFLAAIKSGEYDAVYGLRYYRKDGFLRYSISRILSVIALLRSGIWVFDPNVPYRLFKTSSLENLLRNSVSITLYNVYLSLFHKKHTQVRYIPIVFRDRWGGSPSVKIGGLWKWGVQFWQESSRINL